ncbi:DUF4174 domain-containing protein [Psychroflexus gondwanensis]|uniref:DUF4174 domain-containing protein n=1 Tax=Psychroflexus gondwanensis ACAM 44 TaxID=1189619 RepID=N1WWV9_9FLAO|nr:DUF4174 domain-containing protein [Psychroflexus gondwanensis]EMY81682.1 hypothetical protein pgond44_04040 [Psychroflexus gondwanensis ACAM 44]TXE20798.1 DUF4174 domain-containing protein [Psychroflexus gondwanensis]
MKLFIYILLLNLMVPSQGFNDKRILVLTAKEMTPEVTEQLDRLQKNSLEIEKRRLAIFTLIDGEVKAIINSSDKSLEFVTKNKDDYTETSTLTLYLIGLDQGLKNTLRGLVNPQQIFNQIDSMPMRQAEMRRNRE